MLGKNKYIQKVKRRIYNYIISNYQKIDNDNFSLGDMNYTYKCHYNAVQKVKEGKAAKVYSCIAVDKNEPSSIIIHFINQLHDGKYQDNTWGWLFNSYDYYVIKEIDASEQNNIWNMLDGIRTSLIESNSCFILRKLFRTGKDFI